MPYNRLANLPDQILDRIRLKVDAGVSDDAIVEWLNNDADIVAHLDNIPPFCRATKQALSMLKRTKRKEWDIIKEPKTKEVILDFGRKFTNTTKNVNQAAGITSTMVLGLLEQCADKITPDLLATIISSITQLRQSEIASEKLAITKQVEKRRQDMVDLDKQKFKRESCELFLQWYQDERARTVLESNTPSNEKIDVLGKLMYGEDWT